MYTAVELPLDHDRTTLVDAEDLPYLTRHRWFELNGYAARRVRTASGTTLILLHRQLLAAQPGEIVDHADGDGLNNQRCNLRLATASQNMANRPQPQRGRYRGVYFERRGGSWRAQIKIGGKNRYLGTYQTATAAARAYDIAASSAFGRFARLNFPDDPPLAQLEFPFDFDLLPKPDERLDWFAVNYFEPRLCLFGVAELDTSTCDLPY